MQKKKKDHIIVGKRRENALGILKQEVELSEILKAAVNFLSTSRKKGQETGGLALQQSSGYGSVGLGYMKHSEGEPLRPLIGGN